MIPHRRHRTQVGVAAPRVYVIDLLEDTVEGLGGDLTASKTLSASTSYLLASQLFVKDGVTLSIPAGTTVYALPPPAASTMAPSVVIEQGGKLVADGTASAPITFTALNPETSSADARRLAMRCMRRLETAVYLLRHGAGRRSRPPGVPLDQRVGTPVLWQRPGPPPVI